ncbi:hypothetical protein C8034_v008478 [Colletotrichum sidae]|uniref:Uncharacterized protein n=1 Tax=Colletotrichum sidae TaxID=1347389 RepID=A0A4R8TQH0_9PEZI|nr:hypothetical protein C8034_v008478 [Colletotrichum sidae]
MAFSFTEGEKVRFILAEAIKTSNLDVGHLVNFLKPYNIEPNWLKMQLPTGRTMEQCITATEQMFQRPVRTPDLKRKAMGDIYEQPLKRLAAASPVEPPTQLPSLASATQSPTAHSNPMSIRRRIGTSPSPKPRAISTITEPTSTAEERQAFAGRQGPTDDAFAPTTPGSSCSGSGSSSSTGAFTGSCSCSCSAAPFPNDGESEYARLLQRLQAVARCQR